MRVSRLRSTLGDTKSVGRVPQLLFACGTILLVVGGCTRPALPKPVEPLVATPEAEFRKEVPEAGTPSVSPPAVQTQRLSNGMELWYAGRPGSGYVSLSFASRGGTLGACSSAEIAKLTTRMMVNGPVLWSNGEEVPPPDLRGQYISYGANHEDVSLNLSALPEDLEKGLLLLGRTVQHATLSADTFDRMRLSQAVALRNTVGGASLMLGLAVGAALSDELSERMVPKDVQKIKDATLADVRSCYQELLHPERSVVVVVGDAPFELAAAAAEQYFGAWKSVRDPADPKEYTTAWREDPKVSLIPQGRGYQTNLLLLQPAPSASAPTNDQVAFDLLSGLVAGSLTARSNVQLRHQNAVSYGSSFEIRRTRNLGLLSVTATVEVGETRSAARALVAVLESLKSKGATPEELREAQSRALAAINRAVSSNRKYSRLLRGHFVEGRPADTLEKLPSQIAAITSDDLKRVATKYLRPEAVHVAALGGDSARRSLRFIGPVKVYQVRENK